MSDCLMELTSVLLLSSGIPDVEDHGTEVGLEPHWVDLSSDSGDVLLLELSGLVSLDEGGLSDTTVSD